MLLSIENLTKYIDKLNENNEEYSKSKKIKINLWKEWDYEYKKKSNYKFNM